MAWRFHFPIRNYDFKFHHLIFFSLCLGTVFCVHPSLRDAAGWQYFHLESLCNLEHELSYLSEPRGNQFTEAVFPLQYVIRCSSLL